VTLVSIRALASHLFSISRLLHLHLVPFFPSGFSERETDISPGSPSTIRTDGTDAPLPPRRSVDDERRAEEEMRLP
jgi:hypothetical protein